MQDQQHPKGIGHREQTAAELRAHVVSIPRTQAQNDARMAPIVAEFGELDAGKQKRRPQVDPVAKHERGDFH